MKFLVLGASGMAGHTICLYLKEAGHSVAGFFRRPLSLVDGILGDVRDVDLLQKVLEEGDYDVVINAVGVLNDNATANQELAEYVNGEFPHKLAEITADMKTRIIHMSTDCVFAGNTGPYTESSVPDGESVYDRTKAAGELDDAKNLTLRNSIVGPDVNANGIGLFNWFMKQEGPIKGFTEAMWTGMTTLELAKAMEAAAMAGSVGLVNMVPPGNISKYELLELFNLHFKKGRVEIVPTDSVRLDKTLVRTNFDCPFMPASYSQQIEEMAAWTRAHADLYPHYEIG